MKKKKNQYGIFFILISMFVIGLIFAGTSKAGDDAIPPFATNFGLPNIMFIFDNSDSMQDAPYFDTNGATVRPDMEWHKGYVVEDGIITGKVDNVYGSVSEIAIPAQTQPALAGTTEEVVTSADGTETSAVPSDLNKVYDTEGNYWDTITAIDYTKRIIKVITATGPQLVSITDVDTTNECWIVSPQVDYTSFYYKKNNSSCTHKYNIPVGNPGAVTMQETDTKYVCDANVDWAQVETNFNSTFKDAYILITGGTNNGEERKITGFDKNEKRWVVESAFSSPCDLTTTYKIVDQSQSGLARMARGGNHPASKLYQAKKALLAVLNSSELQEADGTYKINMGFSTYMSARIPRITAVYYRETGSESTNVIYKGFYKQKKDKSATFYGNSNDTFESGYWQVSPTSGGPYQANYTHTGVFVGYEFYQDYSDPEAGDCDQQEVHFKVTSITPAPTDAQPNRHKFYAADQDGYWDYAWQTPELDVPVTDCNATSLPEMPSNYNGWEKVGAGDPCYKPNECYEETTHSYYEVKYLTTYGDYNITDSSIAGYIDSETNMVTPKLQSDNTNPFTIIPSIKMLQDGVVSLSDPMFSDSMVMQCQKSDETWEDCGDLDDPREKRVVLKDVYTSATSPQENTVIGNVFDSTYFHYPGEGTDQRPDGWSYKKTNQDYIYRTTKLKLEFSDDTLKSTWGAALTFPADSNHDYGTDGSIAAEGDTSNDFANRRGKDQVLFVNLPNFNMDGTHYGDDVEGENVEKIKTFVSLGRAKSPCLSDKQPSGLEASGIDMPGDGSMVAYYDKVKPSNYDYTMMPYTNSLPYNVDRTDGKTTPLAASLKDAKEYFLRYKDQDPMTQQGCRKNYIILLTDGLETANDDPDAPKNAAADLRTMFGEDGVKTYVIGFGMDTNSKAALDAIAEEGGCSEYTDEKTSEKHFAYFASNTDELVKVLLEEILKDIIGTNTGNFSNSSAVISRLLEAGDELKLYYAYYNYTGYWRGHLEAYKLNNEGGIERPFNESSEWDSDCDGKSQSNNLMGDADAGCEIKQQSARTIYTWIGTNVDSTKEMTLFTVDNASDLEAKLNPEAKDIDGDGDSDIDDIKEIIGYVRDPGYSNSKYSGTRDPEWPLGDIWHSTPVVVTNPKFDTSKSGYDSFKTANADRETIIYVGANDGMLHALRESNGTELWAYIPKAVLGKVNEFKDGHRFTVDGSISVADLDMGGNNGWKTVLIGGLRQGGPYYYALDVTNPTDPTPMWEMTDDTINTEAADIAGEMAETWSTPVMGHINITGTNTAVVFVGGGYSSDSTPDKGNRVYILKASDGSMLYEFTVGGTMNNVPAEVLAVRYGEIGGTAIDYVTREYLPDEYKGNIEVVYFGDTNGTLWRIGHVVTGLDENGNATIDGGLNSLLTGTGNQYETWDPRLVKLYVSPEGNSAPIFHKPAVADYPQQGCRFILFGTGDENNYQNTTQQYFCEVEDRSLTQAEIDGGASEDSPGEVRKTWKTGEGNVHALPGGEQVLSDPTVYRGKVYFTTYKEMEAEASDESVCSTTATGRSYLYEVSVSTCGITGGDGKRGSLGKGLASSPTVAAPKVYVHVEEGLEGDPPPDEPNCGGWDCWDLPEPQTASIKVGDVAESPSKIIYWREME